MELRPSRRSEVPFGMAQAPPPEPVAASSEEEDEPLPAQRDPDGPSGAP